MPHGPHPPRATMHAAVPTFALAENTEAPPYPHSADQYNHVALTIWYTPEALDVLFFADGLH